MRQGVPENVVVEFHRLEALDQPPPDAEQLLPERGRLVRLEIGGLDDVATSPNDDAVAALDRRDWR